MNDKVCHATKAAAIEHAEAMVLLEMLSRYCEEEGEEE